MRLYLAWRDARVRSQIAANAAKLADPASPGYECGLPCGSNKKAVASGCCDGVWMPYVSMPNLKFVSQDRVERYAFGFDPAGDNVWLWRAVHAVWFVGMDLRVSSREGRCWRGEGGGGVDGAKRGARDAGQRWQLGQFVSI